MLAGELDGILSTPANTPAEPSPRDVDAMDTDSPAGDLRAPFETFAPATLGPGPGPLSVPTMLLPPAAQWLHASHALSAGNLQAGDDGLFAAQGSFSGSHSGFDAASGSFRPAPPLRAQSSYGTAAPVPGFHGGFGTAPVSVLQGLGSPPFPSPPPQQPQRLPYDTQGPGSSVPVLPHAAHASATWASPAAEPSPQQQPKGRDEWLSNNDRLQL